MAIPFDLQLALPMPKSRKTDPQTSHDAAASMRAAAGQQCVKVLMALREFGEAGAEQIALRCGLDAYQVRKRIVELQDAGLADTTGKTRKTSTGRQERIWEAL